MVRDRKRHGARERERVGVLMIREDLRRKRIYLVEIKSFQGERTRDQYCNYT